MHYGIVDTFFLQLLVELLSEGLFYIGGLEWRGCKISSFIGKFNGRFLVFSENEFSWNT